MRKCIKCGKEKELEKFRKRQVWFSHTCKECYAAQYRTGKPNTGRFVKGQIPWIKGKKGNLRRTTPKYIKKGRDTKNIPGKRVQWGLDVKIRDEFKCKNCGSEKNLHAHHIVKWNSDEKLRFDLDNGITLCCSCHAKTERLLEINQGKNNLKGKENADNNKSI